MTARFVLPFALLLSVVCQLLGTPGTASAQAKLNVFMWSEYIDPEIVSDFEKKFNVRVTVDVYDDSESMLAKLEGGGASLYDVVVTSDYTIPVLAAKNLIAPLPKEEIPNFKNLDEKLLNPGFDRGNVYTAPYQWGTVGIYYRKQGGKEIDPSWGLFFDPKKQVSSFVMIDSMRDAIGAALKYAGHSFNTTDAAALAEAKKALILAKKKAVAFDGSVGGKNKVLAGGAQMAIVYNGDAVRGTGEDPETAFAIPKEGSQIWMDSLVISAKAPNRKLAVQFINYILDAEVGAKLSNFNQYATPNKASFPLVNEEDRNNDAIYPSEATMKQLEFLQDLKGDSRLFDELWTQVKAE